MDVRPETKNTEVGNRLCVISPKKLTYGSGRIGKSCDIYIVELLKLMQGHANYAGIVWVKVLMLA